MTKSHDAIKVLERMLNLRDKAFFDKLAVLGITATDEPDPMASKKLGEDLAKMCKAKRLETAAHLHHHACCVLEIHEQVEYGVDEVALKHLVDKLIAEPEIYEAAKTLAENLNSQTPIKPSTRKRTDRASRSKGE